MRVLRAAVALLTAIALLSPVTTNAKEAEPARPDVVLANRTMITTRTTGKLVFRLPAEVDFNKDFHFDVEGDGRVSGFTFWEAGGRWGWDPGLEYISLGLCKSRGCDPSKWGEGFAFASGFDRYLPAGDYEMYVVADGAPVTVTFVVDTLTGESRSGTHPIKAEMHTIQPTVSQSSGGQIYSGGGFSQMEKADYSFFGMWALDQNDVATAFGDCTYYGRSRAALLPAQVAFLPTCPTGNDSWTNVNAGPNGGTIFTAGDYGGAEGIGGWFAAGSETANYGAVAFWMNF